MNIKRRDSNMELLRIISMLLIIIFHYVGHSGFKYTELTINNLIIDSGWFLGELGVNLFILITGYYLCKSKMTFKKVFLLICEVYFFHVINIIVGFKTGVIESFTNISYIFPVITGSYWFVTAYLLIYMFSSYFNNLISSLKKSDYQKFLIMLLVIWCVVPTVFGFFYNNSEKLLFYNRFIWLSIMYFIGAYVRIYGIKFLETKKRSLITSVITFVIMFLSMIFIYNFRDAFSRIGTTKIAYFWTPNNLLMLILSLSLFMFFTKIKIKNNKIINTIASTTLGVYLLHEGIIKKYIWLNIFKSNIYIYSSNWYIYLFISTIVVFLIGFAIDIIRQWIEKRTVKRFVDLSIWPVVFSVIKGRFKKILDRFI